MKNFSLIHLLILFIPFILYGFIKLSRWWFIMIWQKETDYYNSPYDWFFLLPIVPSIYWAISTIIFLDSQPLYPEIFYIYWLAFLFGPFTFFMAFIRAISFGKTSLGKFFGCHLPTHQQDS